MHKDFWDSEKTNIVKNFAILFFIFFCFGPNVISNVRKSVMLTSFYVTFRCWFIKATVMLHSDIFFNSVDNFVVFFL